MRNNLEYWNNYSSLIGHHSSEAFLQEENTKCTFELPENIARLSKMNRYNSELLLAVCIHKIFETNHIQEGVSLELENHYIPLPCYQNYSIQELSKTCLNHFRNHLNFLPPPYFQPCFINIYHLEPNKNSIINIRIKKTLLEIEVYFPLNFYNFLAELIHQIHIVFEHFTETNYSIQSSSLLQNEFRSIKRNFIPEIIKTTWEEFHSLPLQLNKSYIENGGDSIQAIRWIARLKREGYWIEFAHLLEVPRLSDLKVKPILFKDSEIDASSAEESYPLTITQQLIWNDTAALKQKHIYHEQFLFLLYTIPNPEKIKSAYYYLWKKYPQLRVQIHENLQTVQDIEPDFRILETNDLDSVLKEDLTEGFTHGLMRCILILTSTNKYLLWSHHHVLLDGWSVGKLMNEFVELIELEQLPNEIIPVNYQKKYQEKENQLNKSVANDFWKDFFQNREAVLLPKNSAGKGNYQEFTKIIENTKIFQSNAEKISVSLQSYILAHLFLTVYSINGKNRTFCHTISSGRSLIPEFMEEAIGLFIRNIPVGFDFDSRFSWDKLLQSFHQLFVQSLNNEFYNPNLVNEYQEDKPDILFVYENYPYQKITGKNIHGELIFHLEWTGYPITFFVMPEEGKLSIKIIYDADSFSEDFIRAFLLKFHYLLHFFQDKITEPVYQLENSLNAIEFYPQSYPIWYQEIIKNCKKSNHFISCSNGSQKIPFFELENYAIRFRNYFYQLPKGTVIALWGERNEYLPVLIYCILRNGWVYLPIHPSLPEERVFLMLEMTNCQNIISMGPKNKEHFPPHLTVYTEFFSDTTYPMEKEENYFPDYEDDAYILFTSGTTGIPKPVVLTHRNLSAFFDACKELVNLNHFDFIFSFTNIGFDLSIFENLFGFYVDKSIHVIHQSEYLFTELERYENILLNTVPSVIAQLKENEVKNISVLHTAGEVFQYSVWQKLKNFNPDINIYNWYGPTETTTYSTCINLTASYDASIGEPLKNEYIFLSDYLGLAQIEFLPGEILIGGEGVGDYLQSSNEKFITTQYTKFYKTGDRALLKNQKLYLVGRNDRQVKRLGQRFELSEIENWIYKNCPFIHRVFYHKNENQYFILFLETQNLVEEELIKNLKNEFPDYMLPDIIIPLNHFPENHNGKIDYKALIHHSQNASQNLNFRYSILSEFISKDNMFKGLNPHQSFIAQGGDSILGLRIISKLKKWGFQVEISDLLNAKSLNEFFNKIHYSQNQNIVFHETHSMITPIQKWFLEDYSGNKNYFNQSILLEILWDSNSHQIFEILKRCFGSMDILQKVYKGQWLTAKPPIIEHIFIDSFEEIIPYCQEFQQSFHLQEGPVAAVILFTHAQKVYLFVCIHHFYCDGISWRIIMDYLQNTLMGLENPQTDENIYGKVATACTQLAQQSINSEYYPKKLLNPFENLKICTYQESTVIKIEWDTEKTEVFLKKWNSEYSINEKFVAYFLECWIKSGLPPTTIFLETHGRQYHQIYDIFDAIGWFTQFYPLTHNLYPSHEKEILNYVRNSFQYLPNQGLDYMGLENWIKPPFPVLLNFLGSFDENWGHLAKPIFLEDIPQIDVKNPMLAFLEINGMIINGKIQWIFRSHYQFDCKQWANQWNLLMEAIPKNSNTFYHTNIDNDDLNKISEMLDHLDLFYE